MPSPAATPSPARCASCALLLLTALLACTSDDSARSGTGGDAMDGGPISRADASMNGGTGGRMTADSGLPDSGLVDGSMDATVVTEPLPLETYCTETSTLYYDHVQHCYGPRVYPEEQRSGYLEIFYARCMKATEAISEGRLEYVSEAAGPCIDDFPDHPCAVPGWPASCREVFVRNVELGSACYGDECAEGYCGGDQCPRTCRAYAELGQPCLEQECAPDHHCDASYVCAANKLAGEACVRATDRCMPPLSCADGPDGTRCRVLPEPTEACDDSVPCWGSSQCAQGTCSTLGVPGGPCGIGCPDGYFCKTAEDGTTRTCAMQGSTDAACANTGECLPDFFCPAVGKACKPRLTAGEDCFDERAACRADHYCRDAADGLGAQCAPIGDVGDSCASGDGIDAQACKTGLSCLPSTARCAAPGNDGEPCAPLDERSCKDGLVCNAATATCAAPAAQGEACNAAWVNACAAGLRCLCVGGGDCDPWSSTSTSTFFCEVPLAAGVECQLDIECESRLCAGTEPAVCSQSCEQP